VLVKTSPVDTNGHKSNVRGLSAMCAITTSGLMPLKGRYNGQCPWKALCPCLKDLGLSNGEI